MPSSTRKRQRRASGLAAKKQKPIETTVTIDALGHRGHGIAEVAGGRVFVPYALAGENVRVKVTSDRGELIEILKSSKHRIKPACAYFGVCGGCAVQHLKEDAYLAWKSNIVTQALRHKGLETEIEPLINAHGAGRRRVTLHVGRQGKDTLVGFMQARSHRLHDIQECPVLERDLAGAIRVARDLGRLVDIPRRGLDVQMSTSDSGIDCNVMGLKANGYDQHMALAELAEKHDLARLAMGGDVVSERRKPQITIAQSQVTLPINGFLQATREGEKVLSGLVCDFADDIDARSAADLFCGIGPYALWLATKRPVAAVDSNHASVESLSAAVHLTPGLKPVKTTTRDLFDNPVSKEELEDTDLVIFNPPRAGALEQAKALAGSDVPSVVCVSCDPSTFARDAKILVKGGYSLERVIPVDQFRWSAHVEVVGMFMRR